MNHDSSYSLTMNHYEALLTTIKHYNQSLLITFCVAHLFSQSESLTDHYLTAIAHYLEHWLDLLTNMSRS